MPTKPEYKRVSREFLDRILDSPGETYEPRGLFLCDQWIGGVQIWTAMRNLDGEGETEDFLHRRTAVMWLNGKEFGESAFWRPKQVKAEINRIERAIMGD